MRENQGTQNCLGNIKVNASNLCQIREVRKFFFWMAQAAFPKKLRMADLFIVNRSTVTEWALLKY